MPKIHASSVCSGTSLRRKKTVSGSRPHARKSMARLRTFSRELCGIMNGGEGVIIRDEIEPLSAIIEA